MSTPLRAAIARRLGLSEEVAFRPGTSLAQLLAASPSAINSIDLLDAFAGAVADQSIDVDFDLPAFTLDHSTEEVVEALEKMNVTQAETH